MTIELVIERIVEQAEGIKSFILRDPDGQQVPPFKAGAHVNLYLESSGRQALFRSYSIVNGEHDRSHYELGVLRVASGAGGSMRLHDTLEVGKRVQVSLPINNFKLVEDVAPPLFIAGGIGITPLLSMARTLEYGATGYELHYFGRTETSVAFCDEVRTLRHRGGENHFGLDANSVSKLLREILNSGLKSRHVYVCGPTGLMQAVVRIADELGWAPGNVHFEQFSAGVVGTSNVGFKVILLQSRLTIDVAPDETLLDALLNAGVDAAFDCKSGVCGSCLAVVKKGEIDHRDSFLTDKDRKEGVLMCTCVSRARSECIELDT